MDVDSVRGAIMARTTIRDTDTAETGRCVSFSAAITQREARAESVRRAAANACAALTIRDPQATAAAPRAGAFAVATRRDSRPGGSDDGRACALDPLPSELASRYRLIGPLRQDAQAGAEAALYLAERLEDRVPVALKLYHAGVSPDGRVLDHIRQCSPDHVVRLDEHGTAGGRYYEVAEYAEFGSLRSLVVPGVPLHEIQCRVLLHDLQAGLQVIHSPNGDGIYVIHRDLKPENVVVRSANPLGLALADFGVAVLVRGSEPGEFARNFTPAYAAPECFAGRASAKSDYWSLGLVLLEALQGRHPFDGLSAPEIERQLRAGWHADLARVRDARWQTLLGGLLQTDPVLRWGRDEVGRWLAGGEAGGSRTDHPLAWPLPTSAYELAARLVEHWALAAGLLEKQPPDPWLMGQVERFAPSAVATSGGAGADVRLLGIIYGLVPAAPPIWKQWHLDDDSLSRVERRAVLGDGQMRGLMEELYDVAVLAELGRLGGHHRLGRRHEAWREAAAEADQCWARVARNDGPVGLKPERAVLLAHLYREVCAEETGEAPTTLHIDPADTLCCRGLAALARRDGATSAGHRVVVGIIAPAARSRRRANLRTSYAFDPGEHLSGQTTASWGREAPIMALSGLHTDIGFQISDRRVPVACRVRLSWSVSGAWWVYLSPLGWVPATGEHELTIGETRQFSLIAVGRRGAAICRLPRIAVSIPAIAPAIDRLQPVPSLADGPRPVQAYCATDLRDAGPSFAAPVADLRHAPPLTDGLSIDDLAPPLTLDQHWEPWHALCLHGGRNE